METIITFERFKNTVVSSLWTPISLPRLQPQEDLTTATTTTADTTTTTTTTTSTMI